MNPFGVPVTLETLEAMPRYQGRNITREDCAREAMRLIHGDADEGKNMNALQHAIDLKHRYGNGASAMVLVYNATGGTLEMLSGQKKDWLGSIYHEAPPTEFENGQWIAFLQSHPTAQALGCEGARVFRGKNVHGDVRDFFVGWCIPWSKHPNSAYTEVREKDHFPNHWDYLKRLVEGSTKITKDQDEFMESTVSIGGTTTSEVIAILKHKFAPLPEEE